MKLFDTYGYGMSRFVGQLGNEMSCTLKHEKLDFNRERKNPNIVIMGEADKGKQYNLKRKTLKILKKNNADIIVIDPENEYLAIAGEGSDYFER